MNGEGTDQNSNGNNNIFGLCTIDEISEDVKTTSVKSPKKRKSSTSRFSVEQVSLQSVDSNLSDPFHSPSKNSVQSIAEEQRSRVSFFNPDDEIADLSGLDDVFEIGSDNPSYLPDNTSQHSSFRRCHSNPHLNDRPKHVPEIRRCQSKNDMDEPDFRPRDSVRITKHHLKHKPRYMKYEDLHRPKKPIIPITARPPKPNDFMPLSCVVMLCCNLPLGIIALYFAAKSNKNYEKGDYDEAKKSSKLALLMALIGVFVTIILTTAILWALWPETPQRQIN